jgi:glycosyltransferase involved in cell wall biosynthesis
VARRAKEIKDVGKYDAVYVFREAALLGPAWFESKIARSGVPMVFDFDDAVFVPYRSPSNGYLSYLKFPGKTATICRRSSHVMAGNEYLADYALRFNNNVTIVPTTIDTEKYTVRERSDAQVPTIGWSGSHSTAQHLDTAREMLRELAKRERFKLRVIGVPKYEIDGVEVEAMAWRAETEVDDLTAIDIGIMPLPDDEWSKGKCGLKALQYMALGIPTICSPVGVNTKIINDGLNGFIAYEPVEWIDKLTRLLRSSQRRREIGSRGRETVVEEYSAVAQAPAVLKVFESVVKK